MLQRFQNELFNVTLYPNLAENRESHLKINLHKLDEAFIILNKALQERPHDFLGQIYMELGKGEKQLGQTFTPNGISELMSLLCLPTSPSDYTTENPFKIYEPACGSGSISIQTHNTLQKRGFSLTQYEILAEDISLPCVKMIYIQAMMLDIPMTIHHKNTLTWELWYTLKTNPILIKEMSKTHFGEYRLSKLLQTLEQG